MNNVIRRNEHCVIGLPRCDFGFASARSCFVAYGFLESTLEMEVLRSILTSFGIHTEEAGAQLAPGQNAFCAKICSKIIMSQFCIAIINNDVIDGREVPNANVNIEYGMMLGFNKYVIPFQRESQRLPFNVAGLDTIKYNDRDFKHRATQAITAAVAATTQASLSIADDEDQAVGAFLLVRGMLFTPIHAQGDQDLFNLGSAVGFNLINDFAGVRYAFLGRFSHLRPEAVIWRTQVLAKIIAERRASLPTKLKAGVGTAQQAELLERVFSELEIWLIVNSAADRDAVVAGSEGMQLGKRLLVVSKGDVMESLSTIS